MVCICTTLVYNTSSWFVGQCFHEEFQVYLDKANFGRRMKQITITILGLGLFCCFTQMTIDNTLVRKMELPTNGPEKYGEFKLYYSYSALGSGMGSMQPTFRVNGENYVYTREQNSYYGKPDKKPENICKGRLRSSSIDSILNIVKDIKDSLIYKTNTGIMSGGIHNISILHEKRKLTFELHNASDPTAQKIVDILNSNIAAGKQRLWLFSLPDEK
jgi:hypothetical protein